MCTERPTSDRIKEGRKESFYTERVGGYQEGKRPRHGPSVNDRK